jgi:hypothetical protein
VHPELPAADADARGRRCCDHLRALYPRVPSAAVELPVEREQAEPSAARWLTHRPERKQRSVQAELLEQALKPRASLLPEPQLQREPRALPPMPRADDAWLARLPRRPARAAPLAREQRVLFPDADEWQPAERRRALASRAPNGRGCAQPGRR